jgi:hypothetical protein
MFCTHTLAVYVLKYKQGTEMFWYELAIKVKKHSGEKYPKIMYAR